MPGGIAQNGIKPAILGLRAIAALVAAIVAALNGTCGSVCTFGCVFTGALFAVFLLLTVFTDEEDFFDASFEEQDLLAFTFCKSCFESAISGDAEDDDISTGGGVCVED